MRTKTWRKPGKKVKWKMSERKFNDSRLCSRFFLLRAFRLSKKRKEGKNGDGDRNHTLQRPGSMCARDMALFGRPRCHDETCSHHTISFFSRSSPFVRLLSAPNRLHAFSSDAHFLFMPKCFSANEHIVRVSRFFISLALPAACNYILHWNIVCRFVPRKLFPKSFVHRQSGDEMWCNKLCSVNRSDIEIERMRKINKKWMIVFVGGYACELPWNEWNEMTCLFTTHKRG